MEESIQNHKWLFSEEELTNTPSIRAGITLEQELTFRQKQAMLIQTIGLKSGLTQLAVNTSVIFMHRFFMYRTVRAFPRLQLALGFAFAGGKVEESARKLEHLIRQAVDVIRHNRNREFLDKSDPLTYEMDCQWRAKIEALCQSNCNVDTAAYLEMRKLVLECETEIYGVIGFQLQIVHPHNYVIRMCGLLGAENIKDISQYAYNLATASSQLTMLCLKYTPETVATMCLNIAAKAHSVRFEPIKDSNVKWFQIIVPSTDLAEIEAVSEEFLHLIKGCPLLPSWMTNLARMSRVNNNRAMPGPSRAPGASSVSGGRHSLSTTATVPTTGAAAQSSSSGTARPTQSAAAAIPASQGVDSRQTSTPTVKAPAPQLQTEAVISPSNKQNVLEGGSGSVPGLDSFITDTTSSHSKLNFSGGSAQVRPPHLSTASSTTVQHHHHQQQQHRTHPPNAQAATQSSSATGRSRPTKTSPPPASTAHVNHPLPTQQGSHPSGHQTVPRPTYDHVRPQDQSYDQSHPDATKLPYDPSRSRDQPRPHDPTRYESSRHSHNRPDRRSDGNLDSKRGIPQTELSSNKLQTSRSEHPGELSPQSPPTSPQIAKPIISSDLPQDVSQQQLSSGDLSDSGLNANSSPENLKTRNLEVQKRLTHQTPKLSLTMYRERVSTKVKIPADQTASVEDPNTSGATSEELFAPGPSLGSSTDSPASIGFRHNTSNVDLTNFNKPQDSPSNPRIKIKVKRDPSGERHAIKYADSGIKIKIKPLRSDTASGAEGEAGPSGHGLSSTSSTPREEGEIVEDTPPSSGDSEQKSERLKIRLSVPKSDHTSGYSRRESDHGSNGHSGERESGHRSHHGHHGRHHHSKSKKHSKHDRSRYEGKLSSKRSATDYHEERPTKSSRSDTHTADVSHRLAGFSDFTSTNSSSRNLQQQNSGFSINDAFSSTMPHNIFNDDDNDPVHNNPPITPTADSVPPHHERFHQLMAQHRARTAMKPPLPKGPPPPHTSPPPPPPPPTPPNL